MDIDSEKGVKEGVVEDNPSLNPEEMAAIEVEEVSSSTEETRNWSQNPLMEIKEGVVEEDTTLNPEEMEIKTNELKK